MNSNARKVGAPVTEVPKTALEKALDELNVAVKDAKDEVDAVQNDLNDAEDKLYGLENARDEVARLLD